MGVMYKSDAAAKAAAVRIVAKTDDWLCEIVTDLKFLIFVAEQLREVGWVVKDQTGDDVTRDA